MRNLGFGMSTIQIEVPPYGSGLLRHILQALGMGHVHAQIPAEGDLPLQPFWNAHAEMKMAAREPVTIPASPAEAARSIEALLSKAPTAHWQQRIAMDPAVVGGKPAIAGTRIRVHDVIDLLAAGATLAEIQNDYPSLREADIEAAVRFVAAQSQWK